MYEIRPAHGDGDLTRSVELRNAVVPHDAVGVAEVRSHLDSMLAHERFLAWRGDDAVGMGSVGVTPQYPEAVVDVVVPAPERRQGVGSALYRAVSRWARERGKDMLRTRVEERDPDGLAFAQRRGFQEIGRELRLALELAEIDAPAVLAPDGIEITTWGERPELTAGLYEVACEAYVDIPGEEESGTESFEDWLRHDMQGAGDRADATFVALHRGEVVGYSKFSFNSAQPDVAHHDLTGVKRAWRGRGIARALKAAQIAWAKERGYRRLVTGNEERNEPIRRLNERFGYRPEPGTRILRGPLAPLSDAP